MTTKEIQKLRAVEDICGQLVGVKLSLRKWTGVSTAEEVAREIEQSKGAGANSVGAEVYYLPYDVSHKLGTMDSQLSNWFRLRTLPFEDGGWRVVMASKYMELMDGIAGPKAERDRFIQTNILDERDALEKQAMQKLGAMFKRFPTLDELAGKYAVDFKSKPVHVKGDVRIEGLSDAAVEMIRQSEKQAVTESLTKAVGDVVFRLTNLCDDMKERLSKGSQKRTRYGGLSSTVKEVCESLKGLNIVGDPALDKLIADTQLKLTMFSPDALREGGWAAKVMEGNVDLLLKELDNFEVRL